MKKLSKSVFLILLFISILIIVKYSNFPILELPFSIEEFLIKPKETDEVVLNLSIGYIVSSIFYLIVVYYPEKIKKVKVEKVAIEDLGSVCLDAINLIVLMYKNVCKKNEWNFDNLKDDADFFDAKFYKRMELFDAYKDADTLLYKVEDNGKGGVISWDDKLEKDLEDFSDRIDQVITRYIYFLDDEIIDKALSFRNNKFIIIYLGLPSNKSATKYTGNNGVNYAERVPLHVYRNDGRKSLIFQNNDVVDNSQLLHDYIKTLLSLRKLCCNKTKLPRNIALKNFCLEECGQCGIAISDK